MGENIIAMKADGQCAVGIIEIEYGIDDKVKGVIGFPSGEKKHFTRKIRYTETGAAFTAYGIHYMDEFIRIN